MRPRDNTTRSDHEPGLGPHSGPEPAFEPWQLFTLAGLIGATIAVFMARGESPAAVIMISLTIFAAAAVGLAALRTFLPLTQKWLPDAPRVLGGRTRAALEREKTLLLRSIKELEFDRAMGKVSERDFAEMGGRLRGRAARLIRQLDAGSGYRNEIDQEIAKRIGETSAGSKEQDPAYAAEQRQDDAGRALPSRPAVVYQDPPYAAEQHRDDGGRALPSKPAVACSACATSNDADARFCKHCGAAMGPRE
jgi:hypothetical protein